MTATATAGRTSRAEPTALVLALVSLAVSVYLTVEHYAAPNSLACPDTGAINCTKVTTSEWSQLGPVPLALLGAIYFAVMAGLCLPVAWRITALDRVRVVGCAGGVLTALYLVWAELFQVEAICLWCTVVHVASLGLLVAVLWRVTGRGEE